MRTDTGRTDLPTDVEWLSIGEVADLIGAPVSRVRQYVNDGALLAVRIDGVLHVPAPLVDADGVPRALLGVITLLRDGGYDDAEALRWLLTPQDDLPGTPGAAVVDGRHREVTRRAQALAF